MTDLAEMIAAPLVGLSLMPEPAYRQAAAPLFAAGEVEIVEWSFDLGWGTALPKWLAQLLDDYAAAGNLLGHGVTFSPLSGGWHQRQQAWLDYLTLECSQRCYRHVSEHFGFMTTDNFHQSAPLPVPLDEHSLRLGQDRLIRLAEVACCPVGLENLAFAFGLRDVREQGRFLDQLLEPVGGFLLLDLHNLYCQMCNFEIDAETLLDSYPLQRVRELHVSGGSWSESLAAGEPERIRRDTHDDAVPEEVFALVELALARCPAVEAVILERLGTTLPPDDAAADHRGGERFRDDYRRLQRQVEQFRTTESTTS